jgi:hypothetical protein
MVWGTEIKINDVLALWTLDHLIEGLSTQRYMRCDEKECHRLQRKDIKKMPIITTIHYILQRK